MSNDDHPGTNTPPQAEQWVSPSGTPPIPQPANARPHARRRGRPVLLVALLCVIVVIVAVLGIRQLTQTLGGSGPSPFIHLRPYRRLLGVLHEHGSDLPRLGLGRRDGVEDPLPVLTVRPPRDHDR